MRKVVLKLSAVLLVCVPLLATNSAVAEESLFSSSSYKNIATTSWDWRSWVQSWKQKMERRQERRQERREERRQDRQPASVPELDSAGAPIAFALVGGLAAVALERRRRKKAS